MNGDAPSATSRTGASTLTRHVARLVVAFVVVVHGAAFAPADISAQGAAARLQVIGLDGTSRTLTSADLAALPQAEYADSGASGHTRYRGPTLRSLLSLVGAPEGRNLRGASMTLIAIAEAPDGYKVAYSLGEIDPDFGANGAFVALTQNGQPLPAAEGPLRMVVPGEVHRARWIRQLSVLRLVRP